MLVDRGDIINALKLYDPNCDCDFVNKAIDFAIKYHGNQLRDSGDPYYQHPLEVALIITEMRLDATSVVVGLLHDTVEDTDLTLEEIEKEFSPEVAKLVDGVTKLTKLELQSDEAREAENFRKLLLAISTDIRVLLVKLADRLHNMRTIEFIKSDERRLKIALETSEIYGPLAERIGMQEVKLELQDRAFNVLHPDIRASIIMRLEEVNGEGEQVIQKIISEIEKTLKKGKLKARVFGRQKTPYSIWMKMKHKNVSFDQLSDLIAFRIITSNNSLECYHALGLVHAAYKMVPESFQDFISTPKSNGYKSLHTIVVGPMQKRIEIQIRTQEMHDVAELGVAAHWRYKQFCQDDGSQHQWIKELLSILEQTSDPKEFLQNTKLAMYYHQVFCFTPKGSVIALPKGATPLDFAYAVHSEIGHHCVGAKVNGRVVPLKTELENGDQVEIMTSKNQTPKPSWEQMVVTGKARSEIRKFVHSQEVSQYVSLGQAIVEKTLQLEGIGDIDSHLENMAKALNKSNIDALYLAVGEGSISREDIIKYIRKSLKGPIRSTLSFLGIGSKGHAKKDIKPDDKVPIHGLIPGLAMNFASCCHPLPGDTIVGITHAGKGIAVHTADCDMINSYASTPERIISLTWDSDADKVPHIVRIKAILIHTPGALASICAEVARQGHNISNIRTTARSNDFFEMNIDIEIGNTKDLDGLLVAIGALHDVHSVERSRSR